MNLTDQNDVAAELQRAAVALGWTANRDDWWGPARLAFDAQILDLRDRTLSLASHASKTP